MKNYVAKLRENQEKGFSLVELIIVMAIMAILVGVVASQVIPYMEKSRQSKDQQVLSALLTDINSAIAQSGESCGGATTAAKKSIKDLPTVANAKAETELQELRPGFADLDALCDDAEAQLKSKAYKGQGIYLAVDAVNGKITVFTLNKTKGYTAFNASDTKSFASTDSNDPEVK
ncbi:MAG: type II secretion system protein [Lachnospiraceae bacterium]|nr:type II secretion system protein [Lachnospiraceae bacterium]